jgi:hypothetical protein
VRFFEGPSVARPLRADADGVAIEWPDEDRPANPLRRWYALAGFAIVGATTILIGSGVGNQVPEHVATVASELDVPMIVPTDALVAEPALIRPTTYAVPVDGLPTTSRAI